MDLYIDMGVVLVYFLIVVLAGYFVSRKHRKDSAREFLTGGHHLNWFKTGLTLLAMSIDTGIMGVAGLGFLWGLTIQWNAANLWVTAPIAAMFLIPIYWRTKIVTTPELLERRFNVASRAFFSVVMIAYNTIILGTSIYLGSLILVELFHWPLMVCSIVILAVVGSYVIFGGMKTVLSINIYQAVYIIVTLLVVAIVAVWKVGGLEKFAAIKVMNPAGQILPSTLLPVDGNIFSKLWYPLPSGLLWASMAGSAWIACNFGMVQRLLAAKDEQHAQKAILFTGVGHVFTLLLAYAIGVSVRVLAPESVPDKSFIYVILNFFPVGIRGALIAGLIASLLSTIDGLITASGTLFTQDVFLRFIRPKASDRSIKAVARTVQGMVIAIALFIIPMAARSEFVTKFIQTLVADMFGVIIALYLVGIFSRRATPRAAFIGMILGIGVAIGLDFGTEISFPNVGIFSFVSAVVSTLLLSRFEKPLSEERLKNLTVYTTEHKNPFVGLSASPKLGRWILVILLSWFGLTALWEWYIRSL